MKSLSPVGWCRWAKGAWPAHTGGTEGDRTQTPQASREQRPQWSLSVEKRSQERRKETFKKKVKIQKEATRTLWNSC